MSRSLVLSIVCLMATAVSAQTEVYEKGSLDDLRGATRIYVDAGVRTDLRDAIVSNLYKELPGISIVGSVEEASIVVRFSTTVAPKGGPLDQDDIDRRMSFPQRAVTPRSVPPPAPLPGDRSSGAGRIEQSRMPSSTRPDASDSGRGRSEGFDILMPDPNDTPREYRYAIGTVLKPSAENRFSETISYVKRIEGETVQAVRDFVRKFAKAYRKANPKPS